MHICTCPPGLFRQPCPNVRYTTQTNSKHKQITNSNKQLSRYPFYTKTKGSQLYIIHFQKINLFNAIILCAANTVPYYWSIAGVTNSISVWVKTYQVSSRLRCWCSQNKSQMLWKKKGDWIAVIFTLLIKRIILYYDNYINFDSKGPIKNVKYWPFNKIKISLCEILISLAKNMVLW